MRAPSLRLPRKIQGKELPLLAFKSSISDQHAALRGSSFSLHKKLQIKHKHAVVCFQELKFSIGNVGEALQQIGNRLTKNGQVARFGDFLKRDGDSSSPSGGRGEALWEGSNHRFSKSGFDQDSGEDEASLSEELDFPFVLECTFSIGMPKGELSTPTVSCIEHWSRLDGRKGIETLQDFYTQAPISLQSEARNLVEYCCFRYVYRCNINLHPQLNDAAFRKLIFITMLAWQQPYAGAYDESKGIIEPEKVVREEAFFRIVPAVAGVADRLTARHLFTVLACGNEGLSFSTWDTYILELLRVHEERLQHKVDEGSTLSLDAKEVVLCVGANKRQPVLMWNKNNIAWPGRLTLTEWALYFEPNGVLQHQKAMRLDLKGGQGSVERKKVGPFGAPVFDTAIAVIPDPISEPWVLEFVDFSGDGRREVWFAFIDELLSAYSFVSKYGPAVDDPFLQHVKGSQDGSKRAITSAVDGIARVQAVQSTLGRLLEHPEKLLKFSFLKRAPSGELVEQALALGFWGGRLEANYDNSSSRKLVGENSYITDAFGSGLHVVDVDGSVYLQRWMKSSTWGSPRSSAFWKHKAGGKGLVLGKEHVVGDLTYVERAVKAFTDQIQMLERTKATIDGALVKGIPSNIDLLKELLLPFTILSINLRKLQKWEHPPSTVVFLGMCSLVIYRGWLKYLTPAILLTAAVLVFALHNLKFEGRLRDSFGQVVIREQPPSNTLQKILALKEALAELEVQIQKANIGLLKLRNLALAGHPQGRNMVAFGLLGAALVLLFVPFRYVCFGVLLDQFTCELEFRREMVKRFARQVQDWWEAIPAAPVLILPYESIPSRDSNSGNVGSEVDDASTPAKGEVIAEAVREWVSESF